MIITSYRSFLLLCDDEYKRKTGRASTKYITDVLTPSIQAWGTSRCLILDEAHNVKGHDSRWTKQILAHRSSFNYRYLLTGTPTPNNFAEIYTQMRLLDASLVPDSYYDFLKEIANVGNRFSKYGINYFYKEKIAEYEKKFEPYVIRIKSEEAIQLPELLIQNNYNLMDTKQESIYRELVNFSLTVLKEEDGCIIPKKLEMKFPYISQALDNPCMLKGKIDKVTCPALHKLVESFKFEEHGKLESLTALLDKYLNEEKRKVILFDYHPLTIDQLAKHFEKYNPLVIHGQTGEEDKAEYRAEVIKQFKTSPDHNLLIASSIVLSTAVNLQEASRVIYFSRNYNIVHYIQSMKRAHRIGQTQDVVVTPMIFMNSLDVYLDKKLGEKELLDKSIFSKDNLSNDTWSSIFKGKEDIWKKD